MAQLKKDISDPSHAGEVRRSVVASAQAIGMDETDCGKVAIAVTEMATNIVKHAKSGRMLWETIEHHGKSGLRIISLDRGPGIADISTALHDGYSTSGTSGNGLGAVRRLATRFDLYSVPDRGTCIFTEFWPHAKFPDANSFLLGVVSQAGERSKREAFPRHEIFFLKLILGSPPASPGARSSSRANRSRPSIHFADRYGSV